jgi:2-polyprenyl-3-methyl-5-hydroxy-6-metoxy-1,4-benzoquinol methylase
MKKSVLQPKWENTGLSKYRFEQLKDFFANKRVLDVGCAGGYGKRNWMHEAISKTASYTKGIDISESVVKDASSKGFNVQFGDAQNFSLNEKFDVVHAGELIEHLDNFHGFLQSSKKHLSPDGILLLTTPNAMRMNNFIYSMLGGLEVNAEHTCWFCEVTITQLLERNGYKVERVDYIKHQPKSAIRKMISAVIRAVVPDRVAWNNIVVVAKAA